MKELIIVKQLPVIEEKLKELSTEIENKVNNALSLVVTEETVKDVKKVRADLNKDFKELEEQRKFVKEQVLAPYNKFEDVYKAYVSEQYKSADIQLKEKIDNVEAELKKQKEQEIKDYFNEYLLSKNIDFVEYGQAGINVTLSASMKSLKEQAKEFIDKVVDDLNLIETQEHKVEILVEYKQSLNVSQAITTVNNRMKAIEEAKQQEQVQKETKVVEQKAVEQVEVLSRPKVIEAEETFTTTFKVTATKEKLLELKRFLEEGGYEYE